MGGIAEGDYPPSYGNDCVRSHHVLDIEEDLLGVDRSVISPGRVALSPRTDSDNAPAGSGVRAQQIILEVHTKDNFERIEVGSLATSSRTQTTNGAPSEPGPQKSNVSSQHFDETEQDEKKASSLSQIGELVEAGDAQLPMLSDTGKHTENLGTRTIPDFDPRTSPPALIRAVYHGDVEEVEALLAAGSDIECSHESNGRTPCHCSSIPWGLKILQILLVRGASTMVTDRARRNPLQYTASEGWLICTNLLLSYGAPLASLDREKETP